MDDLSFNMPAQEYHAIQALSASALKRLAVSPLDYWAEYIAKKVPPRESNEMTLGAAYHKAILEGVDAFSRSYGSELDLSPYPDALRTVEDLRTYLAERGQSTKGLKPELIERAMSLSPQPFIVDVIKDAHARLNTGKTLLPPDAIDDIEAAAEMLRPMFENGYSEVSIFWREKANMPDGTALIIPCKARLDWLDKTGIVKDLKTFSNSKDKPLDRLVSQEAAYRQYLLQAAWYMRGVRKAALATGNMLLQLAAKVETFSFVFAQTGPACNVLVRDFVRHTDRLENEYWLAANSKIEGLLHQYAYHQFTHGDQPWVDLASRDHRAWSDQDFPTFAKE